MDLEEECCATTSNLITRYDVDGGFWSGYGKERSSGNAAARKMRLGSISPLASSVVAESRSSSAANFYKEVRM